MEKEPLNYMRTETVQSKRRICTVSPEPLLFAHESGQPKYKRFGHAKRPGLRTEIFITKTRLFKYILQPKTESFQIQKGGQNYIAMFS